MRFAILISATFLAPSILAAAENPTTFVMGSVSGEKVFAPKYYGKTGELDTWGISQLALVGELKPHDFGIFDYIENTKEIHRWRIANDHFWGLLGNRLGFLAPIRGIALEDLLLYVKSHDEQKKLLRTKYPKWSEHEQRYMVQDVYAEYMKMKGYFNPFSPWLPLKGIYFDFVPLGKDSILVFILLDGNIRLWEGTAKMVEDVNNRLEWKIKWTARKDDTISTDLKEPFVVYPGKEGSYFFLTRSGLAYVSKKADKGQRKTEPLWKDAQRPITTVITDTAAERTFAFTKASKDDKAKTAVFFELADKVEAKPFNPADLKPVRIEEPMKTVLEHARFLHEQMKNK